MADQDSGSVPYGTLELVDQHCHSLRGSWDTVGGDSPWPGWRRCFTEAASGTVLDRDVPHLLAYRHFLDSLVDVIGAEPAGAALAAARDHRAGDPYLHRLLDHAGTTTLLVDTGFGGPDTLGVDDLRRASGRDVREVVRLESVAEEVLAAGGSPTRSLDAFVDAVLSRIEQALLDGAVAIKSILAYRAGLRLPAAHGLAQRQAFALLDRRAQGRRFDDPVLGPALVRLAAELAARRGVPLQVHTGFGDPDIDLPAADPALLRPLLAEPRTEGCPIVLLHCYPYLRGAAYLAGVYPQVFLDLSLTLPLAEPVAASLVREALALCPATKLLAGSDGHSYPEMHWWGAVVWRRALREVLDAEIAAGALDEAAATDVAGRILSGNARALYGLHDT